MCDSAFVSTLPIGQMDRWSQHRRVAEHLVFNGFYVEPMWADGDL